MSISINEAPKDDSCISNMQNDIKNIYQCISTMQEEIKSKDHCISIMQEQMRSKDQEIYDLKEEVNELKQHVTDLEERLSIPEKDTTYEFRQETEAKIKELQDDNAKIIEYMYYKDFKNDINKQQYIHNITNRYFDTSISSLYYVCNGQPINNYSCIRLKYLNYDGHISSSYYALFNDLLYRSVDKTSSYLIKFFIKNDYKNKYEDIMKHKQTFLIQNALKQYNTNNDLLFTELNELLIKHYVINDYDKNKYNDYDSFIKNHVCNALMNRIINYDDTTINHLIKKLITLHIRYVHNKLLYLNIWINTCQLFNMYKEIYINTYKEICNSNILIELKDFITKDFVIDHGYTAIAGLPIEMLHYNNVYVIIKYIHDTNCYNKYFDTIINETRIMIDEMFKGLQLE